MNKLGWLAASAAMMVVAPAFAGETPLYQAAPGWVEKAAMPKLPAAGDPPSMMILDSQIRIEKGVLWSYADVATRAGSAEELTQLSSLTLPWLPDKGDLIIHELSILRGDEVIDALAGDKRFQVLRREQGLESLQIDGILTATMVVQGARIGDIVRLRYSTTSKDAALNGHVQNVELLPAAPLRLGFGRIRMQWADDAPAQWKLLASGVDAKPRKKGGFTELDLTLPIIKQPEMPGDAPVRFNHPPLLELSTFASWADVSKTMAPLYATDGLIADGSPLAAELDKLKAMSRSPRDKAAVALQLVQDHIRYLAVSMNGGNYTPQKPADTWTLRYGDCKAKTLLLLALLRGLGIEAEPVLANSSMGDFVPERLPSAAAFDHVLVRAVLDGHSLWLDGTGLGSRLEDLDDTPRFGSVLPVRMAGADLMSIVTHADARPMVDVFVDADESGHEKLPGVFDATAVVRGRAAQMISSALGRLDARQRDELIQGFFAQQIGTAQFSDVSVAIDNAAATATLKGHGVTTTAWQMKDRRYRRSLTKLVPDINFEPDRARAAWLSVPVATPAPSGVRYRLRLRLPQGGKGYSIEGGESLSRNVAGFDVRRTIALKDGVVELDERLDATGVEIAADKVPDERDALAMAQAQLPYVVGPAKPSFLWDSASATIAGWSQSKAAEATFARAIAADPEKVHGYSSRANFYWGIGEYKKALADTDKAIEVEPSADLYLQRAYRRFQTGNLPGALADSRMARQLDPASSAAIGAVATYLAEGDKLDEATSLIDQKIAIGGDQRDSYRSFKASLLGTYGDPAQAIEIISAQLAEKPGQTHLFNERCWVKGSRNVQIDSALDDCTKAVETSAGSMAALDSRAMLWFRMGRLDDALRDLDVVVAQEPGKDASRYMRGIVLRRMGRTAEGDAELTVARRIDPKVDAQYARYGIKP